MNNISIIGIGLIGSSIARAIKDINNQAEINIVDSNVSNLKSSRFVDIRIKRIQDFFLRILVL